VAAWKLWLALHKVLPKTIAQRGISDSLSIESHAMNNVMWWCRLFPMPVWCMRFGLGQLSVSYPPQESKSTEWIESPHTPGLRSCYLHLTSKSEQKPRVLCWAFGGAFVSGDVEGNRGIAEHYGRLLGCDVFLVDMRLCPEHNVQDAVLDLYRGYEMLLQKVPPQNVIMLGISSGGGSCVRMLQLAAGDDETRLNYFGDRKQIPPALPQPAGAILLGAFVDYTQVTDSMQRNSVTDWIVSQSVLEVMLPLKETLCGSGSDRLQFCSPVYQSEGTVSTLG
jgi:acetyl esterase/lipase